MGNVGTYTAFLSMSSLLNSRFLQPILPQHLKSKSQSWMARLQRCTVAAQYALQCTSNLSGPKTGMSVVLVCVLRDCIFVSNSGQQAPFRACMWCNWQSQLVLLYAVHILGLRMRSALGWLLGLRQRYPTWWKTMLLLLRAD